MTQKSEVVEIPLPDLFAGPLGRAQISAIKFAEGISTIEAKMTIIDKMNELNKIIDLPKLCFIAKKWESIRRSSPYRICSN